MLASMSLCGKVSIHQDQIEITGVSSQLTFARLPTKIAGDTVNVFLLLDAVPVHEAYITVIIEGPDELLCFESRSKIIVPSILITLRDARFFKSGRHIIRVLLSDSQIGSFAFRVIESHAAPLNVFG